jgi:Uma2 family endonuclease
MPAMIVSLPHHRFTVEKYLQMIRDGILTGDDRVELLRGEIIEMSPIGERHAGIVNRLNRRLIRELGDKAVVAVQNPLPLGDDAVPQPDLAVLKPRADCYASRHPRPAEVLLLIEVADTTQEKDRDVKLPLYARAGIAEAWLVDLKKGVVEVCRKPARDGHADIRVARRADRVAPAAFPDVELTVGQLLA